MMKLGIGLLILAVIIYGVHSLFNASFSDKDFEVTGACHFNFYETLINLTYMGDAPVNASVTAEENFYGQIMNHTQNLGIMHKNDTCPVGFHGYVTRCEIKYEDKVIKLTFYPKACG